MSDGSGAVSLIQIVEAYTKGLAGIRGVLELLKDVSTTLPKDAIGRSVEKRIQEVEHALQLANAEMGESLGYPLCRCTWPPQIMVKAENSRQTVTLKSSTVQIVRL